MLGFFNTKEVDAYADWVLDEVKRALPASFDPTLRNVADKVDRLDKRIAERTGVLMAASKLNIYKKARLTARVRDGLLANGYPESFTKTFSMDLIRRLQAANQAKA